MQLRQFESISYKPGCVFSLGDLLQIVLVAAGDLAIVDLFLPALQNRFVGLSVGCIQEAGVAASEGRPVER